MSKKNRFLFVSDHSLNKNDPKGIVYRFCDKEVHRVTAEQCFGEASFEECKAFSDGDYAKTEKSDHQYERNKVPLYAQDILSPSAEDLLIEKETEAEDMERQSFKRIVARTAVQHLSSIQQRRYYLHKAENMSYRKIAEAEHVSHTAVKQSVRSADRIIRKIICKLSVKTHFQNAVFWDLSEEGNYFPSVQLENRIHSVKGTKPAWPRGQRHKERRQDGI